MMMSHEIYGCAVCLLVIAVAYSCSDAAVIDRDSKSAMVAEEQSRTPDVMMSRPRRSPSRGRRHSLSVTQDMASLSEMIHGDSNRRRLNNVMSFLDEVGKRSSDQNNDDYNQLTRDQMLASAWRQLLRE